MNEIIKGVPYNNPSLIPLGKYDIDIKMPIEIELDNEGSYGSKDGGNWSIINKFELEKGREVIMVDLVTLKKVLDKSGLYPDMKSNEVASMSQIMLVDGKVSIRGDIVKIKKSK